MAEFGNSIHVHAADVSQIISEWEELAENEKFTFRNLLVGTSQRMALENFIEDNLHPKFVYFSDYKKIIGNINLTGFMGSASSFSQIILGVAGALLLQVGKK